ncbi:MAG: cation transporter [Armatimonadetes bacterium]|nr:cation transporter [Armatimonadota bacterium]
MTTKRGAAALSIFSNSSLVVAKLAVGIITGSVSVISEAAHSFIDLAASVLAYFSVRVAEVPADEEHPFGHGKIENLSGVIEATLIFLAAILITYEALSRLPGVLRGEVEIQPLMGIVIMAVSVVTNYLVSRLLFRVARETDSVALKADGEHLRTDVWTSLGVFGGLLLIQITGWVVLDSIIAVAVAALIVRVAYDLTKEAGRPLVDTRLPGSEVERVKNILLSDDRIVGFHKLRTRRAGPQRQIDVHIIVPEDLSVGEAHDVAEQVEDKIRKEFAETHVITHVEPDTEENLRETPPEGLAEDER